MKKAQRSEHGLPVMEMNNGVATLRLRRPEENNRIDPDDIAEIREHIVRLTSLRGLRVLLITGTGSKTFSSGFTVEAIVGRLDRSFEDLLDAIEGFPHPTICALNGSVYGGATDLALCCDFRIGVRGSKMFMPAARFGLHYYPGGLRRYVSALGLPQAKRLFLTGQTIDAEEMLRIGFLTELVDRKALRETVDRYIEAIRACEPGAVASMKRQLAAIGRSDTPAARSRAQYEKSLRSEELRRRLGARSRQ
jgi:enoyl-CoA hydratase/carnithine racemase